MDGKLLNWLATTDMGAAAGVRGSVGCAAHVPEDQDDQSGTCRWWDGSSSYSVCG